MYPTDNRAVRAWGRCPESALRVEGVKIVGRFLQTQANRQGPCPESALRMERTGDSPQTSAGEGPCPLVRSLSSGLEGVAILGVGPFLSWEEKVERGRRLLTLLVPPVS